VSSRRPADSFPSGSSAFLSTYESHLLVAPICFWLPSYDRRPFVAVAGPPIILTVGDSCNSLTPPVFYMSRPSVPCLFMLVAPSISCLLAVCLVSGGLASSLSVPYFVLFLCRRCSLSLALPLGALGPSPYFLSTHGTGPAFCPVRLPLIESRVVLFILVFLPGR